MVLHKVSLTGDNDKAADNAQQDQTAHTLHSTQSKDDMLRFNILPNNILN